jgi:hypothetical protein
MASGKHSLIYEDLPYSSDGKISTRVLALFPGAFLDPIQCRLRAVFLDNGYKTPEYEALSYCWGEENDTRLICCDGQAIAVSRNLETALRHLRLSDRVRIVWADALCINQQDIPERNFHVSIMSLIYRYAKRVVVWLGEASDTTEQALWLLDKLSDASEKFGGVEQRLVRSVWYWPELKEFLGVEVGVQAYYRPGPVQALNDFMQRPWFSRLWIVQEVTSAREIHVLCGEFHINWRKLYDGLKFARLCGVAIDTTDCPAYICWAPFNLRLEQQRDVGLQYLLEEYRYADCRDPKDKIFAHFGLTHLTHLNSLQSLRDEYESIGITPDYEMPVEEIYKIFAYGIIRTKGNLDILSLLGLFSTETASLPSWVPDWKPSIEGLPLLTYTRSGSEPKLYRASGESKASPKLIQSTNTLVLKGFIYDTILHVGNKYERLAEVGPKSRHSLSLRTAWVYLRPYLEWTHSTSTLFAQYDYIALRHGTGTRQEQVDAYWQTLFCASKSDLCNYPEIFGQEMDAQRAAELYKTWSRWRIPTRLAFRLGLSSPLLLVFPLCILLDLALLFLLNWSSPWVAVEFLSFTKLPGRRLARTRRGHLALVVAGAREDDSIGIFQGGKTPFVIRATGTGAWRMLGDAYVNGIMKGEVWDELKCEEIHFD